VGDAMRTIICGTVWLGLAASAGAETVLLSELDEETRVYIQRGNQGHNVECYEYTLRMIKRENPGFDPKNYYVEFDTPDVNGIAVGATEAGEYYTCEDGVLRNWDGRVA